MSLDVEGTRSSKDLCILTADLHKLAPVEHALIHIRGQPFAIVVPDQHELTSSLKVTFSALF